jgi:hypothetical protein
MSRVFNQSYRVPVSYPVTVTAQEPHIYCPVCRVDYPQSQTDNHILRHTMHNPKMNYKK